MYEINNLTFRYMLSDKNSLEQVSLKIKKGKITLIAGPSGSGKTTLFNIISGIDLSNYSLLLTILVLSGFLYSIASVIGDFLIILRKQVYLLYVYVAMALLTNILTPIVMREFGLFGAGLSFVIVMLFYTIASWIVFVIMRRKEIQKYESVE